MKLPSMIKGWFNPQLVDGYQPEQLLKRYVLTGDAHYMGKLVALYHQALFHYLLSQSDQHTAEDVVQITWEKVMKSAHNYQPEQRKNGLKAWLFSIARNSLIDEFRKQQKWHWQVFDEANMMSLQPSQESALIQKDTLARFNEALERLPFHQRESFILQQEGFSIAEIATLINENFETVKSRLRYAKSALKKMVELNHEGG